MNIIENAKRELELLGYDLNQTEEDPNKWICENVIELLTVFIEQGHSGSSAPFVIDMFTKLAKWETLSPITGEDHEWIECGDGVYQNNRLSNVFKENGIAYTIDGYHFWHWSERDLDECEDGYPGKERYKSCFSSGMSRKLISFPYTAEKPEMIEVKSFEVNEDTGEPEEGSGWWKTVYPANIELEYEKLMDLIRDA